MKYSFLLRNSREKIWSCKADNTKLAWSYFSQIKKLNIETLKNLYNIKKVKHA